ncbi:MULTISPECIES: response regulator transcription factor [Carboxydocella]|uniref:Two component transcriptional regulator, LuxR family n=2 Tax=Carboxydocella TaxID=178898 RepID=A0A1T4M3M8_9FIRM|nr:MULTISPECIES: response regulator transcription factor [Carboxydocella]AVX21057.1 DNA-binding response regulator, NarL/FixJ family [Carboxydocella thermautotrophica]AVX31477.1 DNA-binding response regulator, NarL/FixJ family [Carboxydocella thermautotrophica]SJZ61599.1 two component transcriptional regulator, LuxR family [Carboxydocella sporoproducens DSM 16521]GAW28813.1 chemotaxis protein CheY [Carboxydocella sp. ULO1]GAW32283.1 chemotaxis protein CheY [Carboxydocella sp. JDF658]
MAVRTLICAEPLSSHWDGKQRHPETGWTLLAVVRDLPQLAVVIREKKPDLLLLNVDLPGLNMLKSVRLLREMQPQITYIVIFFGGEQQVIYIEGENLGEKALQKALAGEGVRYPEFTCKLLQEFEQLSLLLPTTLLGTGLSSLSRREIEVLSLLAKGYTDKEIAGFLIISEKTVRNHIRNIKQKLRAKNRTQLVLLALQNGLSS